MRKVTEIQKEILDSKQTEESRLEESSKYLEFSKKYNKEHEVTGPFDAKFKKNKKAQKKYMADMGKAWEEYKNKKGLVSKKSNEKK